MTWRIEVVTETRRITSVVTVQHPRDLRRHIDAAGRGIHPADLRSVTITRLD